MPLFEYKAVSPSGETVRGTMEAASKEWMIAKLQEGGNIPLSANEAGKGGFNLDFLRLKRRGMNTREVGRSHNNWQLCLVPVCRLTAHSRFYLSCLKMIELNKL